MFYNICIIKILKIFFEYKSICILYILFCVDFNFFYFFWLIVIILMCYYKNFRFILL